MNPLQLLRKKEEEGAPLHETESRPKAQSPHNHEKERRTKRELRSKAKKIKAAASQG